MQPAVVALIVCLLGVAVVHTRSRTAGAVAAAVWCLGALALGAVEFQTRDVLTFAGISTAPWVYFAFISGVLVFNAVVVLRVVRRRRQLAHTGPRSSAS